MAGLRACGRGEAGVGKTALLRSFCDEIARRRAVLWGTCDPLFMPRPFGPLFAMAEGTGGELGAALAQDANPQQVALALARDLRSAPSTLLVLEDLHWADEATLDVFTLLVRRADAIPALVVGTYRDDALENAHPLRRVLGGTIFERILAQGQQVVDWAGNAMCELASSERPPGRRLAGQRLQARLSAALASDRGRVRPPARGPGTRRNAAAKRSYEPQSAMQAASRCSALGGAGREIGTQAQADQGNLRRVDVRPGMQVIHDGRDYRLPVRAHNQALSD